MASQQTGQMLEAFRRNSACRIMEIIRSCSAVLPSWQFPLDRKKARDSFTGPKTRSCFNLWPTRWPEYVNRAVASPGAATYFRREWEQRQICRGLGACFHSTIFLPPASLQNVRSLRNRPRKGSDDRSHKIQSP